MLFDSPLVARRSLLAAVCLTPLLPLPVWSRNLQPYRARRQLLGTEITITVADDSQPHVAERVGQAFAEMQRLERLMSRFDPASQVSLINRSNGPVTVAPELLAVLQQARVLSARTRGLFNPLLGRFTAQADPQGRPLPGAVARSLLQHTQPSALALDTGKRYLGGVVFLDGNNAAASTTVLSVETNSPLPLAVPSLRNVRADAKL